VLELRKTAAREGRDLQIGTGGGGQTKEKRKTISRLLSTGKCSKSKGIRTFTGKYYTSHLVHPYILRGRSTIFAPWMECYLRSWSVWI